MDLGESFLGVGRRLSFWRLFGYSFSLGHKPKIKINYIKYYHGRIYSQHSDSC